EERYANPELNGQIVKWSSDGKTIAASATDRTVKLWEPATGKLRSLPHRHSISGLGFSSDGKLLASAEGDGPIKVWEVSAQPEEYATIPNFASIHAAGTVRGAVAFSPDGKPLAFGSRSGAKATVKLVDAVSGQERATLTTGEAGVPGVLRFSRDGKQIAVSIGGRLLRWDASSKEM